MTSSPVIIQQGNHLHVQHGTDAGLYASFYMESVKDEEASLKEGRVIYRDVEYVKVMIPGDKNTVVCRPVCHNFQGMTPPDTQRWPNQYQAFKNQQVQVNEGTPLEHWAPISRSQAMSLKAVNIHTVEHLAGVSDANLHNLGMGARDLREKAIAFLEQAKNGAGLLQLQEENASLRTQLEAMQNQLNALTDALPKKKAKVSEQSAEEE